MFLNAVTIPTFEAKTSIQQETGTPASTNKNKPTNQHGTRSGPKKSTESVEERVLRQGIKPKEYEDMLDYHWELTKDDILDLIRQYYLVKADDNEDENTRLFASFNPREIDSILYLTKESMVNIAKKYNRAAFLSGVDAARNSTSWTKMPDVNYTRYLFRLEDENKKSINKLMDKLSAMITKTMHSSRDTDVLAKVVGIFQALEFRLRFISYAETMKSYNYGYAVSAQALGRVEARVSVDEESHTCERCATRQDTVINLTGDYYDIIPPFHPECSCSLKIQ